MPVEQLPLNTAISQAFGDDAQTARDLAGTFAIAQSLSLGEQVNFRNGPLAYTRGNEQLQKKLRVTAILATALVLLLFGELGVRYFLVKKDLTSLDKSIRTIYSEVFPNRKKPVDEVSELRSEIKRLSDPKAAGSALTILRQLALAKGDDVTGIYEIEIDGDQVRGKADARSAQAASDFRGKMVGILAGTEVSEIKSRPDGSTGFSFRAATVQGVNK
jgi:general secretion pathway protein L